MKKLEKCLEHGFDTPYFVEYPYSHGFVLYISFSSISSLTRSLQALTGRGMTENNGGEKNLFQKLYSMFSDSLFYTVAWENGEKPLSIIMHIFSMLSPCTIKNKLWWLWGRMLRTRKEVSHHNKFQVIYLPTSWVRVSCHSAVGYRSGEPQHAIMYPLL